MSTVALIVTLVGLVLSAIGAAWLLLGFSPSDPRYVNEGGFTIGERKSKAVPNLLRDQRKVGVFVALGGGIQVLGGVLAVIAALHQ